MGNPRALRYACAVAAIAGLTGCNPPARQSETAELRNRVSALEARVAALETKNIELQSRADAAHAMAKAGLGDVDSLRETVNSNADIANRNTLAEMTRRGACGTRPEPIYASDGSGRQVGVHNKVIPCTLEDLKP